MPQTPYILQPAKGSTCPGCNNETELLCHADGNMRNPWFYICWQCKRIFHIAKGEVKREE